MLGFVNAEQEQKCFLIRCFLFLFQDFEAPWHVLVLIQYCLFLEEDMAWGEPRPGGDMSEIAQIGLSNGMG